MLSGEVTNTNHIILGVTQSGLEFTIYHTLSEHANHYTTYAVILFQISYNRSISNDVRWNIK
jgi:hypothetical protein